MTLAGDTYLVKDLRVLVESGRQFGTIYADPPWAYGNQATRAATDNHYETVSVAWLCNPKNMPVADLAPRKGHLHLWTTNAFLFDARRVLEAWGFEYKSCFIWVKPRMGIGNYWRVSHEFLLLGVRGGLTFGGLGQRSWVELPRGRHSAKPEAVRQMIERVSPSPRLELFARKVSEGWHCWGNEVARDLLTIDAKEM
jgi:N6-adenosine-specific RNA methylase IME4